MQQTYYLYANPNKSACVPVAVRAAETLLARGARVQVDEWLYARIGVGEPSSLDTLEEGAAALISLGGDGTLLRAVPYAAKKGVPLLGVNMGHIGFLLEADESTLDGALDALAQRRFTCEERSMLACETNGGRILVMNDAVVSRGDYPGIITARVFADDEPVFACHGDGVIVSSPTGTTGYALSAGGPVISPDVPCVLVMPICSRGMHQHPVVLPPDTVVRLQVEASALQRPQLIVDGRSVQTFERDACVLVRPAKEKARFIRFEQQRFLGRLRKKQAEWSKE